jgi:hypothetical protein
LDNTTEGFIVSDLQGFKPAGLPKSSNPLTPTPAGRTLKLLGEPDLHVKNMLSRWWRRDGWKPEPFFQSVDEVCRGIQRGC